MKFTKTNFSRLSTPFHKYGNVCGWGLPGQVEERGGGNVGTSATTSDEEMYRNTRPPKGLLRHLLLGQAPRLLKNLRKVVSEHGIQAHVRHHNFLVLGIEGHTAGLHQGTFGTTDFPPGRHIPRIVDAPNAYESCFR